MKKLLDVLKLLGSAILLIGVGVAGKRLLQPSKPKPFVAAETVTFDSIYGGNLPANTDLRVTGGKLWAFEVVESVLREEGSSRPIKDRRSYMPMVPADWNKSQPVKVVFSAKAWAGYRMDELIRANERNARWYRAPWPNQDAIRTEMEKLGYQMLPDAILLEEPAPLD